MVRASYQTKYKQEILSYLRERENSTATVEEIYSALKDKNEHLDLSTVYRNIERLVKDEKLLKLRDEQGNKACYQIMGEHADCHNHLHLQCSSCGKVIHLDCTVMQQFIDHIREYHGFDPTCDNSIIFGKCKECEEKEEDGKKDT
jgi:Fur family ferric uptake transcriptional regulator